MQIKIDTNLPSVRDALKKAAGQVPFAASVALNATARLGQADVVDRMRSVFDKPTPWVLNSLRVKRATKTSLVAEVAFKDKNVMEDSSTMVAPHVYGGQRRYKGMEARLFRAGLLPAGYNAVPGAAAKLDAFGNMGRGQVTQLLNVLGTYTEAGYSKADARTVARLAKGNDKKGVYGFRYWVNPVAGKKARHLPPGVYKRVATPFGSSLQPILIFVKRAAYRQRLPFYDLVDAAAARHFAPEFDKAFEAAMKTALLKTQDSLL